MRNLLVFLFGLLVLAGCKKDKEEVKPKTPAEAVVGQYTLSAYSNGSQTVALPYTNNGKTLSGTVNVAPVSGQEAQVNITLTVKITGQADQAETASGVLVQPAGTGGYTLTYGGQPLGTADGTTLTLVDAPDTYTAKK